jgi:hypothetical protein
MSDKQQDLSWSNVNDQAADLGIGTGGSFFQIEDGENVVRILSAPKHYSVYFIAKGIAPIFARNADDDIKAKHKPTHRFACHVFNQKTKKVQIAEFGYSIVKQIGDLANSSQYKYEGNPPFDIIITKKGSGMQTEYSVNPGRNEDPLPEEAQKQLAEMQDIEEWLEEKKAKQAGEGDNPNATEEEKEAEAKKKA